MKEICNSGFPISGPKETEAAEAIAQNPSAIPRCSTGKTVVTTAIPTGISKPPPIP